MLWDRVFLAAWPFFCNLLWVWVPLNRQRCRCPTVGSDMLL